MHNGVAVASTSSEDLESRVNLTLPVFVAHDSPRANGQEWNDGFLHNEGVTVSFTREVAEFQGVKTYLGAMIGKYDNSEGLRSEIAGVVVGASKNVTESIDVYAEATLGVVTGYASEHNDFNRQIGMPAVALSAGVRYEFNDKASGLLRDTAIGAAFTVLPTELAGAEANSGVVSLTLSRKF